MIFNLPSLMHFHVLDFLDLKSIVRVDTAHMQDRRYFSRVWLRDFIFKEEILLNGPNGIWFWMRGALLESVRVECSAGFIAFTNLMVHQGHAMRTVDFSEFELSENDVADEFFEELQTYCPNITHLDFNCTELTPNQLKLLVERRPNLIDLNISFNPAAGASDALNYVWRCCKSLLVLNLAGLTISGDGLMALVGGTTSIVYLDLSYAKGLTNLSLATIFSACPELTHLTMCQHKISSAALVYLAYKCSGLKSLCVDITEVSSFCIASLAEDCQQIQTLEFDNTDISDDTISLVAEKFLNLRTLSLKACPKLTNTGLLSVALYCSNLTSLDISDTAISYRTVLTVFTKCASLTHFVVRGCPGEVSDTGEAVAEYTRNSA